MTMYCGSKTEGHQQLITVTSEFHFHIILLWKYFLIFLLRSEH